MCLNGQIARNGPIRVFAANDLVNTVLGFGNQVTLQQGFKVDSATGINLLQNIRGDGVVNGLGVSRARGLAHKLG